MSFLKKIYLRFSSSPLPLRVLFLFFVSALFLGDGKQTFVEVYIGIGILCSYGALWYKKLSLSFFSRHIETLWVVVLGYFIIRTVFSDSVGYSISATVRILEAYLVYRLFYSFSSEKTMEWFWNMLAVLGVVASCAFVLFLFAPSAASFLPTMNLLYSASRHNHLADLLLFVLPGITVSFIERNDRKTTLLFLFFTISFLLTFARGAWILYCGFLLVYILFTHHASSRKKVVLLGAGGLFVIFFLVITFAHNFFPLQNSWLTKQATKTPILHEARIEYWRQAIFAIKERSWFGSGPGTFYLQSKRLESGRMSYSWFAHSFPLQSLVELGFVGVAPLFLIMGLGVWHGIKQTKKKDFKNKIYFVFLTWGVVLSVVYSFYEFNLDYLVVWLLVCVSFGLFASFSEKTKTFFFLERSSVLVAACLVSLYAGLSLFSLVASLRNKNQMAFFIAPFLVQPAIRALGDAKSNFLLQNDLVMFFHRRNPDVLFSIGQAYDQIGRHDESARLYKRVFRYDPYNDSVFSFLVDSALRHGGSHWEIDELIGLVVDNPLFIIDDKEALSLLPSLQYSQIDQEVLIKYLTLFSKSQEAKASVRAASSRFFYTLGLAFYKSKLYNPATVSWRLSLAIGPKNSLYYVELASLYEFVGKTKDATILLETCLGEINGTQNACGYFFNGHEYTKKLYEPGGFINLVL